MQAAWVMSNIPHPEADALQRGTPYEVRTKIVGMTLAATALCGVGTGTASAATPTVEASHSSVFSKADGPVTVVAYQASLNTVQSVTVPAFACPASQPWLVDMGLSQNRVVPRGVAVAEPGGIGVTILQAAPGPGGLPAGGGQARRPTGAHGTW